MDNEVIDQAFATDVRRGLSASPKYLMSRYFYDDTGDKLFQAIMDCPEYYLTRAEAEILEHQGAAIAAELMRGGHFDFIELGSGDGTKMAWLLDALHEAGASFVYRPVDISPNVLELLEQRLHPQRPWLQMEPLAVNYMEWLGELKPGPRRVFAFMGSNLGNFKSAAAIEFLHSIRDTMGAGDALLIGLDLKKDPALVKAAYDDAGGITAAFNLNLLQRINRELGGDFVVEAFSHRPRYDAESGLASSYLRSEADQQVNIRALGEVFDFAEGEEIHMEISQKYDDALIEHLSSKAGFEVTADFRDRNGWFSDQLWRPLSDT
jgi:dimethylhistidine N-methyltransferase